MFFLSGDEHIGLCQNIPLYILTFSAYGTHSPLGLRRNGPICTFGRRAYNDRRMPRFKLKGTLERSASADLWKQTLSRIPTAYGRLAYLVSLRDPNSGIYRHHGLAAVFGRDESARALRESHEQAFLEWLQLDLASKTADLRKYVDALEEDHALVLKYLASTARNELQLPECARQGDRLLFHRDFETAVALLTSGFGAS